MIGSNAFCKYAALLYGDRAISVQAHPEIRDDYMEGLMEKRGPGIVPAGILEQSHQKLGTPLDDKIIADQFAAFFKQPRG